jgi:hypothetical protein
MCVFIVIKAGLIVSCLVFSITQPKEDNMTYTFKELAELESGTILDRGVEEGIPWIIMRGPGSVTAYLGLPIDHPFAKLDYNDVELSVHGGLTYGSIGDGDLRTAEWYWLGWDYAHHMDCPFFSFTYPDLVSLREGTQWTAEMVHPEVIEAARQLIQLAISINAPIAHLREDTQWTLDTDDKKE